MAQQAEDSRRVAALEKASKQAEDSRRAATELLEMEREESEDARKKEEEKIGEEMKAKEARTEKEATVVIGRRQMEEQLRLLQRFRTEMKAREPLIMNQFGYIPVAFIHKCKEVHLDYLMETP